jgi:hypothetical protein
MNDNGQATVEIVIGGRKVELRVKRARITAKRVYTFTRTFDRQGKRITPYRPSMMPMRLISFQEDGGMLHIVGEPKI